MIQSDLWLSVLMKKYLMTLVKDGKADFICRTIKRVEGPQQRDFTVRGGRTGLKASEICS